MRTGRRGGVHAAGFAVLFSVATIVTGCKPPGKPVDGSTVYVTAKQMVLRDRVAAVSQRVGLVQNGEKLKVLERARRFLKVETPDGKTGWLEEKWTADQATAASFEALKQHHLRDRVIAEANTADEVYLHATPGRESERFFLLSENEPLKVLGRATAAKPLPPGTASMNTPRLPPKREKGAPPIQPLAPTGAKGVRTLAAAEASQQSKENIGQTEALQPTMESWWLVRDSKGDTGWIYGGMLNVQVPDTVTKYAEGARVVGAYVIRHTADPDSGMLNNGQTVTSIPEYVTVMLTPSKSAPPYDFDQVRVFIWNAKKHRYETSFRQRNIAGFLPVEIGQSLDPYAKGELAQMMLPSFTVHVLPAGAAIPQPDPATGVVKPKNLISKTYRLEGNLTRRLLPPNTVAPEEMHPIPEESKDAKKKRR